VEKLYAGNALLEVTSTVHAAYPGWETVGYGPSAPASTIQPQLQPGDFVDYLFATRFTEVIRARDLMVDKIYGGRLVEVISTTHIDDRTPLGASEPWRRKHYPWEPDPGTLNPGDLYEFMNAQNLTFIGRSSTDFEELFESVGGNLVSTIECGGKLT